MQNSGLLERRSRLKFSGSRQVDKRYKTAISDFQNFANFRLYAQDCNFPRNSVRKHFVFDLTCDVIGEPEVNKIYFPCTVNPGLLDPVCDFKIGSVILEIKRYLVALEK